MPGVLLVAIQNLAPAWQPALAASRRGDKGLQGRETKASAVKRVHWPWLAPAGGEAPVHRSQRAHSWAVTAVYC